jgi:hypothetical protein
MSRSPVIGLKKIHDVSQSGDHPEENIANFGCKPVTKLSFRKTHFFIFLAIYWNCL